MKKEFNEIEIVVIDPAKSEWNKPEMEVLSINDKTLSAANTVDDGGNLES